MPFQVTHDTTLDCIRATLSGDLETKLVAAFFAELLRVAEESGCRRALSDLRQARIKASTADIYWMAEALKKKNIQTLERRAIVTASDREDYDFWATVCANMGHRAVRVFQDYDEAKRWVLEDD